MIKMEHAREKAMKIIGLSSDESFRNSTPGSLSGKTQLKVHSPHVAMYITGIL